MKILVVVHEYPPVGGGGGQVAKDICAGLAQRGHAVTLLTAHYNELPREEIQDGVRLVRLPSLRTEPYRAGFITMGAFVLAGLWHGRRLIREFQPDVIHAHFAVPAGPVAWVLSRLTGIPYVLTAHLGDVPGGTPEKTDGWFHWVYPFTHAIWRRAAQVVAVSDFTRSLARKHYPVDVQVIPNGVDLAALPCNRGEAGNPPRILFAGRFMQQKNPLRLVEVLARLKHLDWTCVMVGDGPLRGGVETAIAEAGLASRFTLTGWITPPEVLDWFDQSDILFMPSRSEGLPVVGVQAIAKGLAVVCSRTGGFLDIVTDAVNGYLLDPDDISGFAEALARLLTDGARLRDFQQASRIQARKFDLPLIVRQYEEVFEKVVKGSKP